MKTVELHGNIPTLQQVLELADEESLVLRTAEGREYVLSEIDDMDHEVALIRQNKELMKFLDDRSKAKGRISLQDVKRRLGL